MINRDCTVIINWILENILPPIVRDQKWFMHLIVKPIYGKHTSSILEFKEKLPYLTDANLVDYYSKISDAPINSRPTDLNTKCINYILDNIVGTTVLDCGCGRGYLAEKIWQTSKYKVYAADIVIANKDKENLTYLNSNIENISLPNCSIDTIICAHTLEHIINYPSSLANMLRICKQRLIIVMPCQRNYRYTVDLHVHFLPYLHDFKRFLSVSLPNSDKAHYLKLGGDFVCVYDK